MIGNTGSRRVIQVGVAFASLFAMAGCGASSTVGTEGRAQAQTPPSVGASASYDHWLESFESMQSRKSGQSGMAAEDVSAPLLVPEVAVRSKQELTVTDPFVQAASKSVPDGYPLIDAVRVVDGVQGESETARFGVSGQIVMTVSVSQLTEPVAPLMVSDDAFAGVYQRRDDGTEVLTDGRRPNHQIGVFLATRSGRLISVAVYNPAPAKFTIDVSTDQLTAVAQSVASAG